MLKNNWHIVGLSAVFSVVCLQHHFMFLAYFVWMLYLALFRRPDWKIVIASLFAFLFFLHHFPSPEPGTVPSSPFKERNEMYIGTIEGPVEQTEKRLEFLYHDSNSDELMLAYHFFNEAEETNDHAVGQLKTGARCNISGKKQLPDAARNPYQFDYRKYLHQQGIVYQLQIDSLDELNCEQHHFMEHIYSLRKKLLSLTAERLETETASWAQALVFGEDRLLEEETIELFQRWGLSHILAISGLHIGIVVGLMYWLLVRRSLLTKENAQWFIIAFLPVYAMLAGGQPSVWRASSMVIFAILLQKSNIRFSYSDIVNIIFLTLLLMDEYIIYHIGFQLSFAVTFGLILSAKWMKQTNSNMVRILQISFVSQMMILPLQVHYFFIFQPLSILLNLIVVPYFSFFVIPSMFMLLPMLLMPNSLLVVAENCFLAIHSFVMKGIGLFDKYAHTPLLIGDFPIYFALIYYVVFLIFMTSLERKEIVKSFRFGMMIVLFLILLSLRPYFSPVGTVTMLDIGQGDAYIIELPFRKGVFIIDAGSSVTFGDFLPSDRVYKQIIRPYLWGRGIYEIDAVFLSHQDIDHTGSMEFLVKEFGVKEVIISNFHEWSNEESGLWKDENIKITTATFNEVLNRNGQQFQVMSPSDDFGSDNDNSLVLYTEIGGKRWLFTGDAGKTAELKMVDYYPSLRFDVLKVGHHGSNTSTDERFIQAAEPRYALISAGVDNRYGHPTDEVIHVLEEEGVTIYRTDRHGAVQYLFKGEEGSFRPFLKE